MEKNFNVLLEAVAHELKFWKGFVQTPRFLDGWVANVKTPELQQSVYDFIKSKDAKILDVGSGVVSILNGTPCRALNSVDLLGNLYPFVFDYEKHAMKQPVSIAGEYLLEKVQRDFYDIVHMSNAIDHAVDPKLVFENLVACCKPGGFIILLRTPHPYARIVRQFSSCPSCAGCARRFAPRLNPHTWPLSHMGDNVTD